MMDEKIRAMRSAPAEVSALHVTVGRLRKALEFYADTKNYQQRGWQGDPDPSLVDSDNGKIARAALEPKR
jgi:hypothetical protein